VAAGEVWIVYVGPTPEADSTGNRVIRPDGRDEHWATSSAPIGTGPNAGDGWQLHPDWSPDGRMLTFVIDTYPSSGHRDIWISNADGTGAKLIYDCQAPCDQAEDPAWSKDGRSVMFVRIDHDHGVSDGSLLQLVDVATGAVTTIATTAGADYFAYPRFSPDGRRVVAEIDSWTDTTEASTLKSTAIAVVDLSVSPATVTKLTEPSMWAAYPDWHPTQDLIVFSTRPWTDLDTGPSDLYTISPDGSAMALLYHGVDRAVQPTWLPDGSGVIFTSVAGTGFGTPTMWTIRADGSGLASATSDMPRFGTHARLRPLGSTP
jgi:Tol biopolymer transport system component